MSNFSTESLNFKHMTKQSMSTEKFNKALKALEKPITLYIINPDTSLSHLKRNKEGVFIFPTF